MVSETIEQRCGHLGVAEDARPFAEGEIGGDDDRGALIEAADQVEQQLATGLSEGKISKFVEHDEVLAGEVIGSSALAAIAALGLEPVDEIDDIVEPAAGAGADAASRNGDGEMRLAGSGRSSDILPGITATVSGFIIRFTRAAGTLWLLFGVSVSKAETCSSSINSMERWRIFPAG